jgi:hypothetical protein
MYTHLRKVVSKKDLLELNIRSCLSVCAASAVVFVYLGEFHSALTRSRAVMHMSVFLSIGGIYQQGNFFVALLHTSHVKVMLYLSTP